MADQKATLPPMKPEDRGRTLTQWEIAERLGISRARVGQIEKRAMKKLAAAAKARGLELEDVFG